VENVKAAQNRTFPLGMGRETGFGKRMPGKLEMIDFFFILCNNIGTKK
jgi:hypothetical protein